MSDKLLENESTPLPPSNSTENFFLWFFGSSFVLFLFLYAIRPVFDPDFWWHLKTGEFMLQTGGLLHSDPFTFTGDGVVSARESIILKGYWLWEVTAYALYSVLGFYGIFLLNFLTVAAMAGVVVQQMRRQHLNPALIILLTTLGFFLFGSTYALERPQVISFLFGALLLVQLARVPEGGRLGWPLPLLMMLWANLHGGFVVGDIVLLCFAGGAVIEYRQDLQRLRQILFWIAVGIGASLLNPNGPLVFGELFTFQNSALMNAVNEYQSTWVRFQKGTWSVAILWLLIALYGVGVAMARRFYWPELVVFLFLAYFSAAYTRNVGFFAVAMLPAVACSLQQGINRGQWRLPSLISLLVMFFCTIFVLWLSFGLWQNRQGAGPVRSIYPEKAIAFLHESGLQGRMFNSYEYGGYLLWRLAPQIKVFIDGRGMEATVFDEWKKLSMASRLLVSGRPEYEVLLEKYAIDYVIQPIYDGDGHVQPLMKALLPKAEWVPIYLDTYVYILARLTPLNADAIDAYRMDKNEFNTRLLLIYNHASQSNPQEIGYQIARAGMLIYLGMYEEARAQVEAIRAVAPNDPSFLMLQRELGVLRTQSLRP
ncbi:MAG: hypothetical protein U1D97_03695 [Desulfuromonadales bacterium]|nr:hypothetical protein [Desulfuromonadales bacterium]